jgi:TPR repeat protein
MLRTAAERGHAPSAFQLACCYGAGSLVRRDSGKEHSWLLIAESLHHPAAKFNLAIIYFDGNDAIHRNRQKAVQRLGSV